MSADALLSLRGRRQAGHPAGITSVCSAHELVIEAALLQAVEDDGPALIEATCNQVNQEGGYTGMRPAEFRRLVETIADRVGLPRHRLILGGDHLGPNPWKHLPAPEAMRRAREMIAAYAAAGYEKLHLDASMGCRDEPAALADEEIARRAAGLAGAAEAAAIARPVYIIGTEVPTPGGATEALDHLRPTSPEAVLATYAVHERAFRDVAAWERVIAIVVQPGVEFADEEVALYDPARAVALSAALDRMPGLVYEAHSTDYQPQPALRRLVQDGFAILKVGPALSFALREALYGLDAIAGILRPGEPSLVEAMEAAMLANPRHWQTHYRGTPTQQRMRRHYSYSDRIRYYWPSPEARAAVEALFERLQGLRIPQTLISQYLPRLHERVLTRAVPPEPRRLVIESVRDVLRVYGGAAAERATTGRAAAASTP